MLVLLELQVLQEELLRLLEQHRRQRWFRRKHNQQLQEQRRCIRNPKWCRKQELFRSRLAQEHCTLQRGEPSGERAGLGDHRSLELVRKMVLVRMLERKRVLVRKQELLHRRELLRKQELLRR